MVIWLVVATLIAVTSYASVHLVRQFSIRNQILDVPNQRSSHNIPTPRGGGIIISVGTLLGIVLYASFFDWANRLPLFTFVIAGGAIAITSGIDDIKSLSAKTRFGVQFIAAGIVVSAIGYFQVINWPNMPILFNAANLLITMIWIVGLTNAYNFMDGIDGLAASQAIIAGLSWAVLSWLWASDTLFILSLLIVATTVGFLIHNWHPATIFMGDIGSAFLGFTFATLPLIAQAIQTPNQTMNSMHLLFFAVACVWLFLFDSLSTFFHRLLRGENVLEAHREHLYQRLTQAGSPHNSVTQLYILLASLPILFALVSYTTSRTLLIGLTTGLMIILGLALYFFVQTKYRHTMLDNKSS